MAYSKSILQQGDPRCFFCGSRRNLQRHHVMTGPNRALAEKYGLWIWACDFDHLDPKEGVQYNRKKADGLKRLGQIAFEAKHSHDFWMETFRKNYLTREDDDNGETGETEDADPAVSARLREHNQL